MSPQSRTRTIIGLLIILIVAIVGFQAYTTYTHSKMGKLTTDIEPYDAVVTLNGKPISANKTAYMQPGTYTVRADRDGFNSHEDTVEIKKGQTSTSSIYLLPANDTGKQWLANHPNDALKYEGRTGALYDKQVQTIVHNDPIIKDLPFIAPGDEFRIDYGQDPNDSSKIIVYVQLSTAAAKPDVITWLTSRGYDPNTLNIQYALYSQVQGTD